MISWGCRTRAVGRAAGENEREGGALVRGNESRSWKEQTKKCIWDWHWKELPACLTRLRTNRSKHATSGKQRRSRRQPH
jgi:hypothetical protein